MPPLPLPGPSNEDKRPRRRGTAALRLNLRPVYLFSVLWAPRARRYSPFPSVWQSRLACIHRTAPRARQIAEEFHANRASFVVLATSDLHLMFRLREPDPIQVSRMLFRDPMRGSNLRDRDHDNRLVANIDNVTIRLAIGKCLTDPQAQARDILPQDQKSKSVALILCAGMACGGRLDPSVFMSEEDMQAAQVKHDGEAEPSGPSKQIGTPLTSSRKDNSGMADQQQANQDGNSGTVRSTGPERSLSVCIYPDARRHLDSIDRDLTQHSLLGNGLDSSQWTLKIPVNRGSTVLLLSESMLPCFRTTQRHPIPSLIFQGRMVEHINLP